MSLQFFSVSNINQFQYLMYRPLYWFGNGATPNLNLRLSLATAPTYSTDNKSVTINLKPYKWSNGETVTAQDVMFWMNMLHAEKSNWADYSAGGLPDNIAVDHREQPDPLTFNLTGAVNPYWFTYNELSQITPMPDGLGHHGHRRAADSGGCATAAYGTADASLHGRLHLPVQAGRLRPGEPARPPTTRCPPTPPTRSGRWSTVRGS